MNASLLIKARDLSEGDTLLLPFGKTATITSVKVGRQFVNFRTQFGPSRVGIDEWVNVEAKVL